MIPFSTSSADGTVLQGRHWELPNQDAPKAVMALVHGFGEHSGRYEHMANYLNTNGIAVVSLDLHGHGQTRGRRGVIKSYDDFRADLKALLKQTSDLYAKTPIILYGHSMGGGIVLDHGLRDHDELPIIASAPFIRSAAPISKALRLFVKAMTWLTPKGSITKPIDGAIITNLSREQAIHKEDTLNHGTMGFRLARGMVETGADIAENARLWDRPLLLLHSKADQLTSFEASSEFAQKANQVEFLAFETEQHEMHNDAKRDLVYSRMTEFILKHAKVRT